MKRDLGLVRELMLKLEAYPTEMYGAYTITPDDPLIQVEDFSEEQIAYHLELLQERGLIEVPASQPMIGIVFTRLSWDGHEYLGVVRDPKVWRETKEKVEKVGSWTFGLVVEIAKGIIKGELQKHGLPLS
jgi:hypothetical protein